MKFSIILNHFFKEPFRDRPDLSTLACVNAECQHYGQAGPGHLGIRKVSGRDRIRLWRCRSCQDECSERRGSALCNTKLSEAKAINVIAHLDAGCSIRATSRLPKVAKESVARRLKARGRHAQRFHEQEGRDLTPRALEFDEQWSFVKKNRKIVRTMNAMKRGTCGIILRWRLTAS